LSKEAEIPARINANSSLEGQAKQAFDMRNDLRSTARSVKGTDLFSKSGGQKINLSPFYRSGLGLQQAYSDIGRPELFDSIKHLIK